MQQPIQKQLNVKTGCCGIQITPIWKWDSAFISHQVTSILIYVSITKRENSSYYSDIHSLHNNPVPLHNSADLWIKLNSDTLSNKNNYGIVRLNDNGSDSWVGGKYNRGGISVSIRELGDSYAISADTQPPVITPLAPENWTSQRRIRIRLTDNKSGIASFRGEINGEFVLFTHDSKSSVYTYDFDESRLPKGEKLTLVFTATDATGNSSEYRKQL